MIADVLLWALFGECLAWCWFLLASPLFSSWPDRGLGLSKAAGILLLSTVIWIGGWLGLPLLTARAGWAIAVLVVCAAAVVTHRRRSSIVTLLAMKRSDWLVGQLLWIVAFVAFLGLRGASPSIIGGEKFMDFAFLNSAIRAFNLPPGDPWLSGSALNYYFFGYVTWATVAKMLAISPGIAYNLALASVPAAVAAGTFSIALTLTRHMPTALGSAFALVFLGNLAGAAQIGAVGGTYDIWAPTRVIPGTINEFPFFSFLWGDLHPHVMAMPSFVLCAGLACAWLEERPLGRRSFWPPAALGASAGVSSAISAWDLAPIGVLLAAATAVRLTRFGARSTVLDATLLLGAALAVVVPAGLALTTDGVDAGFASEHSPLSAFLLVQGGWMLPFVLLLLLSPLQAEHRRARRGLLLALGIGFLGGLLTWSATVGLLLAVVTCLWDATLRKDRPFPWLLGATAATMLLIAECVYVDDVYGPALERMNVVFKLHLHANLLLGLTWGFCCFELFRRQQGRWAHLPVAAALALVGGVSAVYPLGAILQRLSTGSEFTLDGTRYLKKDHPGDFALIAYLNHNVRGQPTVVEATADPYSYSARISANTGLPTILGWANHERVWRRGAEAAAEIARRAEAVRTLYEGNVARASAIVEEFKPRYVVVGKYERQLYPSADFGKFSILGSKIFDQEGTQLFELAEAGRDR
jgi:YYY domain-containing protein